MRLSVNSLALLALIVPLSGCASLRGRTTPAPCVTASSAPSRDLAPATLHYAGTFATADRMMRVTSTVVVRPHPAGGWAVAERAMLPRGLAVDSARLESRTLVPRERTIEQGPMRVTLAFADARVKGTVTVGGQSRPISAALCGPLVADGAGAFLVIGRLPLAEGYRTTLRHLDVQKQAVTVRQLTVLGSERVSTSAGTFDVWAVQLNDEGEPKPTMIWVDKATLAPVKFSASQGPVTITMELAG